MVIEWNRQSLHLLSLAAIRKLTTRKSFKDTLNLVSAGNPLPCVSAKVQRMINTGLAENADEMDARVKSLVFANYFSKGGEPISRD